MFYLTYTTRRREIGFRAFSFVVNASLGTDSNLLKLTHRYLRIPRLLDPKLITWALIFALVVSTSVIPTPSMRHRRSNSTPTGGLSSGKMCVTSPIERLSLQETTLPVVKFHPDLVEADFVLSFSTDLDSENLSCRHPWIPQAIQATTLKAAPAGSFGLHRHPGEARTSPVPCFRRVGFSFLERGVSISQTMELALDMISHE